MRTVKIQTIKCPNDIHTVLLTSLTEGLSQLKIVIRPQECLVRHNKININ